MSFQAIKAEKNGYLRLGGGDKTPAWMQSNTRATISGKQV